MMVRRLGVRVGDGVWPPNRLSAHFVEVGGQLGDSVSPRRWVGRGAWRLARPISSAHPILPTARIHIRPGAAPTTASDGIRFGTDLVLYRSGAETLALTGNLLVTGTIQGSGAPLGLGANNTWTGTNQFQGAVSFTGSVSIPDGGLTFTGPGATATRAALSLVPGTDLQPFDADLTQLAGLTKTKGNLLGANGTLWTTHPAGTNGQVLTVDSAQPLGFRWADPVTDLDDPVLTGSVDLSGADQIRIIEAAAPVTDATGEMALDNNAWGTARGTLQIHDGTAPTFVVNVLASDTPLDGQVPRWNTGGTITWEDPAGAPADASYLTQTPAGGLSGEQALSALSSGIMRVETATGVVTSLTTSAGISSNLSDETGTGALVFGTSPTIGSPSLTGDVSLSGASSVVLLNGPTPVTDATAELAFDTNAWGTSRGTLQVHDGTASTYLVNVLASDTPVEGGIRSVPSRWRIRSCTPFRWGNNRGGEKKPTVRNSTRPP